MDLMSHPMVQHKWQYGGEVRAALNTEKNLNIMDYYLAVALVNPHLAAKMWQPMDSYSLNCVLSTVLLIIKAQWLLNLTAQTLRQ